MKISATSVVAVVAAVMIGGAANAKTTLTFGGSDAVGSMLDKANAKFSELVTERTDGEVTINFISGEQLGNDVDVIQQVMQGSTDLYGDVLGWYANWVPDLSILNWGFTFDDNDHVQTFIDSDLYADMAEQLRKEQGLRVLAVAPTQPRVLFGVKELKNPGELSGVKMRVPDIKTYLLLWETLGAQPSRVAWGEVFLGLKTGTLEATEGPVSSAYAAKFHQAAPFVMRTDHLVSTYQITINDKTFESLTPDQQKTLTDTAVEVTQWARSQAESETDAIITKMADEGAMVVEVDASSFAEKARAGVETMEADGVWSAGLWQQIRDLRD
ncbi:TRAP transporter substrate-binding protein [Aurantimonas sp. A2-1-M11]|uniref:TRAP transporter substrate-binding protein n=1 Tax=Aurantimonas sp. A2-1-M11 TaxID=3113712 RepID=UPI002F939E42